MVGHKLENFHQPDHHLEVMLEQKIKVKKKKQWSSKRNSRCEKEANKSIVVKLNNCPTST
jgi:hypothetical protein